jgi:hypothetical protein
MFIRSCRTRHRCTPEGAARQSKELKGSSQNADLKAGQIGVVNFGMRRACLRPKRAAAENNGRQMACVWASDSRAVSVLHATKNVTMRSPTSSPRNHRRRNVPIESAPRASSPRRTRGRTRWGCALPEIGQSRACLHAFALHLIGGGGGRKWGAHTRGCPHLVQTKDRPVLDRNRNSNRRRAGFENLPQPVATRCTLRKQTSRPRVSPT